jgi:hypothetical protein
MKRTWLLAVVALSAFAAVGDATPDEYDPEIIPSDFVSEIDNPYLPLEVGRTWIYEADTEDGLEVVRVTVTNRTKRIMGVRCTEVRDTVWLDGELIEDTRDWFAQHKDGTVWYFGEAVDNYEDGVLVDHDGSWKAGVDGALPGIAMLANPKVGKKYRMEFYEDVAEDMAKVLSLDAEVEVPFGEFEDCLKTLDWTPLEPGVYENKYYARGVGLVLETSASSGERLELVDMYGGDDDEEDD